MLLRLLISVLLGPTVARPSSGGVVIRCVLPVFRMTLYISVFLDDVMFAHNCQARKGDRLKATRQGVAPPNFLCLFIMIVDWYSS